MSTARSATKAAPAAERKGATETGRYELVVFCGDDLRTYELPDEGEVSIGRADGNRVRIDDPSVSRQHALLRVGAALVVEDLGGSNGTFIRDKTRPGAGSETLNVRQLVRRKAEVAIGDSIIFGTVSAVIRHARGPELPAHGVLPALGRGGVVVESPAMKTLYEQAALAARANISVLILGETGVGKEVLAHSIHAGSPRAAAPFMGINCAALTASILETELFGCEKGAFTGAVQAREGLFEAAQPGTVFLDEVGELPLTTQAKLLRVLEDRTVIRVGANKARSIDVRFIAATNRDLEAATLEGAFRSDLLFRLNGISLTIPPLRERREEIESLVRTFLAASERDFERAEPLVVSEQALELLLRYSWPGNVRELRNVIDRASILCSTDTITVEHLPTSLVRGTTSAPERAPANERSTADRPDTLAELQAQVKAAERARIEEALERCAGNQTRAAELLGMSRRTLVSRLSELNLRRPRKPDTPSEG